MLNGLAVSSGIGIGKVLIVSNELPDYSKVVYSTAEQEKKRLDQALADFKSATGRMAEYVKEHVGEEEAGILEGQAEMASDPFFEEQLHANIDGGKPAEAAVVEVSNFFAQMFRDSGDELMMQRASDVLDMQKRLVKRLLGIEDLSLNDLSESTIIVAEDFTPSMAVGINKEMVAGVVTEVGGYTSHSAILARKMEIPAIFSVEDACERLKEASVAALDGNDGVIELEPDGEDLSMWKEKQKEWKAYLETLTAFRGKETLDADGNRYQIYANIANPEDASEAAERTAEGVGLFRTEFLFMDHTQAPTEEEQYEAYRKASAAMSGKEIIIRTLDVGGDKEIPYMNLPKEENPFLGYRAIRYCLKNPELYRVQLRALLRASAEYKNIQIMVPMVTRVEEIREVKSMVAELKKELEEQQILFDPDIKVGIMIETSASVLIADLLAREADFFSIGTNDLVQYTMAADRGNAQVKDLYSTYYPAVLRAIAAVIKAAKDAGIAVGMCGEAAADPKMIPLLMSWGLDEFSVGTEAILSTRAKIRDIHIEEAKKLAEKVLNAATLEEVETLLW